MRTLGRAVGALAVASLATLWIVAVAVAQDSLEAVDPTPDTITFAALLTAAGAGIAAGIITALVELTKNVAPAIHAKLSGASLAFIFSAVLFVLAGIAVGVNSLDEGLVVFLAWLTCATSAVGINSTLANRGTLIR